ncbi:hypothetical protein [Enterococcus faecalis]|uniref:hypothetical protein n=1 Tax=Enterococcus faecalis TaxID=1351 RepID=UPI0001F0A98A|nr:hypothetical protein [Enterococcus faecalis]EFU14951.1 putative phage protein, HK97 gp10 family [Enterococcus faecalis TX1342]EGO6633809.1 hypothetical protein [Enterococcus faecalis]EGO8408188.1 hypothetical protein [Enterococcus faecalis]PQD06306.1 hypothetical protein CUM78_00790 [Enterococcus faecalis]
MSEVTGTEEIIKNIESKLGKARTSRMVNKALKVTGVEIVKVTKNAVAYYKDSGATYDEVVKSNVKGASYGIKEIDVGWRGDKSRWRLVHLNEFGYTKSGRYIRPRGMGAVQRAADQSKAIARNKTREVLEELAK